MFCFGRFARFLPVFGPGPGLACQTPRRVEFRPAYIRAKNFGFCLRLWAFVGMLAFLIS
jgi:hypothetical protein